MQIIYENVSVSEAVKHIAGFASGIWQIHPFCEGNTRSTAVFVIKYLKTFGFQINNDVFFENLLLDAHHELKNRFLHVDYGNNEKFQSAKSEISKCQNRTFDGTLEDLAILQTIAARPNITQKQLAELTGKSERTIKRRMMEFQEKEYLRRVNGKRNGYWELNIRL